MYKKVKTEEEMNIFDSIWIPAWQEKGFELECMLGDVERYLIHNEQNEYIGSVSFRPYHLDSTIDEVFPFHQNELICSNLGNIIEIENLALAKEKRELANLKKVILTVVEHSKITRNKYYIATIDLILFKAVQKFYPVSVIPLHNKVKHKGINLVPIIIDAHHTLKNLDRYKWIHHFILSKESSVKG